MVDQGRRGFFKRFAAATSGALALGVAAKAEGLVELVDPDKELWVPGAKTFIDLHTPKILRPDADADVFGQPKTKSAMSLAQYFNDKLNRRG